MKRFTLRARLTVLYGALFFLAGAVLLGVTYLLVQQSLEARSRPTSTSDSLTQLRANAAADPNSTFTRPDGQVVSTADIVNEVKAEREQFQRDTLNSLLTQGGLALLGVGVLAGASGWLVANRALRPVHQITATARRIGNASGAGSGLHERIALSGPKKDEVKQLADTFDSMLERLDRSFDSQRRFVANASHELRTPLALNRALVELAVTRPEAAPETQQLGESLLSVNDRHEKLIDGLLTLADSENPVTAKTPVDFAEVAEHVVELATPAAHNAGLTIRSTMDAADTAGDPVLLERMAQNLVENAVRHNEADGWIEIRTGVDETGQAMLTVSNTGPVVPSYEVESLFQPFRRLGQTRSGPDRGFGLGLSIVRAIARAHDGDVRAEARPEGGLTVTVTLPAHSPES